MAIINYMGPDDQELGPRLYDIEFGLLKVGSGRAIVLSDSVENAVTLIKQKLLILGYHLGDNDVYDVIFIDIYVHPTADISNKYKAVIIGITIMGTTIESKAPVSLDDYV